MKYPVLFARRCWAEYRETFNVSPYWRLRDHEERRVPLEMMAASAAWAAESAAESAAWARHAGWLDEMLTDGAAQLSSPIKRRPATRRPLRGRGTWRRP